MRRFVVPLVTLLIVLLWLEPLALRRQMTLPLRAAEPPASRPTRPRRASTRPIAAPATTPVTKPADALASAVPPPASRPVAAAPTAQRPLAAKAPPPRPAAPPPPTTMPASSFAWQTTRGKDGFWRIGKTAQGVWWFISPANNVEFLNTVTTVQPYQTARDTLGTIFKSRDYDGTPNTPGNTRLWAEKTLKRVYATGFKGLGAWCHPIFHELNVPITRDLNIWANAPANAGRFYDPGWFPAAENTVRIATDPLKTNANLIGYFLDNELDFSDARLGPGVYFDNLPPDNPNRKQVVEVIHKLWPDIEHFNHDWGLSFKDYSALDSLKVLPKDPPETYAYLLSAWIEHLMRDYFQTTTQLVRKYDPNHLILGIRYAGYAPPEVIRAGKNLSDAQSLNYYVSDAVLDPQLFGSLHDLADQPLIISEYSFHSLDGRSGNRNTVGFQAQVTDQQARADAYKVFTTRIARLPWIIGADWFQWADEPPSGRMADGEDVNFGIVDVDDREYPPMVDAVRSTAPKLNAMHRDSLDDPGTDIWRDGYASLPTQTIPYLHVPIVINGELSEWPAEARLQNIRLTKTVGLERVAVPAPNIYIGWRKEGLYLGMEVFDSNPVAGPITGRWWTRDVMEMWVSTRPVASDQTGYNPYCHQFFFIPSDGELTDGKIGSVGQWHRPGDAIKDHLLPHPGIRYNCRILSDRYVVEMLIPADALHGWDPINHPNMAFNVHVRNSQHALDYFWSAPKEVQTQVRPRTWGSLMLQTAAPSAEGDIDGIYNNTLTTVTRR